ncbi:helix-turn-helix transcriptional regulator [Nocardia sp. NBC_01503]|uniref:winged helix-turn-helix transcriptional regulator n=1 Tax=Nocardia sp. NBC_01503 TaxID=2975997 RepID=UPI002E7B7B2A|nr:helix-turn-helix domain-containing protein [Nocardia sp. NBC_01503]WTL34924.1 helix-turn-helix transcriptional regulator [Nocardia sp. NBC_01503]
MSESGDADHPACGMSIAIDVVGGKWRLHLMWVLGGGPVRFGDIRRLLTGVSEKVLAENLRHLQASGVVHREIYPEIPPRVEYSLTPLGVELNRALRPLERWGDAHRDEIPARPRTTTA